MKAIEETVASALLEVSRVRPPGRIHPSRLCSPVNIESENVQFWLPMCLVGFVLDLRTDMGQHARLQRLLLCRLAVERDG